jgi:hypothetical protein
MTGLGNKRIDRRLPTVMIKPSAQKRKFVAAVNGGLKNINVIAPRQFNDQQVRHSSLFKNFERECSAFVASTDFNMGVINDV